MAIMAVILLRSVSANAEGTPGAAIATIIERNRPEADCAA